MSQQQQSKITAFFTAKRRVDVELPNEALSSSQLVLSSTVEVLVRDIVDDDDQSKDNGKHVKMVKRKKPKKSKQIWSTLNSVSTNDATNSKTLPPTLLLSPRKTRSSRNRVMSLSSLNVNKKTSPRGPKKKRLKLDDDKVVLQTVTKTADFPEIETNDKVNEGSCENVENQTNLPNQSSQEQTSLGHNRTSSSHPEWPSLATFYGKLDNNQHLNQSIPSKPATSDHLQLQTTKGKLPTVSQLKEKLAAKQEMSTEKSSTKSLTEKLEKNDDHDETTEIESSDEEVRSNLNSRSKSSPKLTSKTTRRKSLRGRTLRKSTRLAVYTTKSSSESGDETEVDEDYLKLPPSVSTTSKKTSKLPKAKTVTNKRAAGSDVKKKTTKTSSSRALSSKTKKGKKSKQTAKTPTVITLLDSDSEDLARKKSQTPSLAPLPPPSYLKLWTSTYKPKSTSELVGQTEAVSVAREWLTSWETTFLKPLSSASNAQTKTKSSKYEPNSSDSDSDVPEKQPSVTGKCLLLNGPSGVGKTALVYALARDYGYQVLEYSATSTRLTPTLIAKEMNESLQSHYINQENQKFKVGSKKEEGNIFERAAQGGKKKVPPKKTSTFGCSKLEEEGGQKKMGLSKSLILIDDLEGILYYDYKDLGGADQNGNKKRLTREKRTSELWRALKVSIISARKPIIMTCSLAYGAESLFLSSANEKQNLLTTVRLFPVKFGPSLTAHLTQLLCKEAEKDEAEEKGDGQQVQTLETATFLTDFNLNTYANGRGDVRQTINQLHFWRDGKEGVADLKTTFFTDDKQLALSSSSSPELVPVNGETETESKNQPEVKKTSNLSLKVSGNYLTSYLDLLSVENLFEGVLERRRLQVSEDLDGYDAHIFDRRLDFTELHEKARPKMSTFLSFLSPSSNVSTQTPKKTHSFPKYKNTAFVNSFAGNNRLQNQSCSSTTDIFAYLNSCDNLEDETCDKDQDKESFSGFPSVSEQKLNENKPQATSGTRRSKRLSDQQAHHY